MIYIVIHCEFIFHADGYVIDEMVFHIASSYNKAIQYIKSRNVSHGSWWEIQKQAVDSIDWPERIGSFGRKGGKLKIVPYDKFAKMFKKHQNIIGYPPSPFESKK